MNLQMRLKDERRLGLSEGRAEGRAKGCDEMQDEMTLGLIHALQAQGMPQKQIVEAQHYYEQVAQADNESAH